METTYSILATRKTHAGRDGCSVNGLLASLGLRTLAPRQLNFSCSTDCDNNRSQKVMQAETCLPKSNRNQCDDNSVLAEYSRLE